MLKPIHEVLAELDTRQVQYLLKLMLERPRSWLKALVGEEPVRAAHPLADEIRVKWADRAAEFTQADLLAELDTRARLLGKRATLHGAIE